MDGTNIATTKVLPDPGHVLSHLSSFPHARTVFWKIIPHRSRSQSHRIAKSWHWIHQSPIPMLFLLLCVKQRKTYSRRKINARTRGMLSQVFLTTCSKVLRQQNEDQSKSQFVMPTVLCQLKHIISIKINFPLSKSSWTWKSTRTCHS